jgi:hypothetical protein
MEGTVLFLAAFVSLVLLFAQVKMFSVDATLKEILDELRRTRRAIEGRADEPAPLRDPGEPTHEDAAEVMLTSSSGPQDAARPPSDSGTLAAG